jgi:glycosyltransferase involved in cell wall biosynthesis
LIGCKGFATLIKALRILEERGKPGECRIIGEGGEQKTLEGLIREWGLTDRISLTGSLPLHQVYEALREADVFVLLSEIHEDGFRDGFPTVVLEAMAMSLPVVATRISGIPEMVIHEETGLLVEERDAAGAAEAIERLMSAREWGARLGEAGRKRVAEKFALDRSIEAFVHLLRENLPSVPGR